MLWESIGFGSKWPVSFKWTGFLSTLTLCIVRLSSVYVKMNWKWGSEFMRWVSRLVTNEQKWHFRIFTCMANRKTGMIFSKLSSTPSVSRRSKIKRKKCEIFKFFPLFCCKKWYFDIVLPSIHWIVRLQIHSKIEKVLYMNKGNGVEKVWITNAIPFFLSFSLLLFNSIYIYIYSCLCRLSLALFLLAQSTNIHFSVIITYEKGLISG